MHHDCVTSAEIFEEKTTIYEVDDDNKTIKEIAITQVKINRNCEIQFEREVSKLQEIRDRHEIEEL